MSSIVEQFGTATVLLFSVNDKSMLSSKRRLRELLNAPDIQIYSGLGVHEPDLARLTCVHEISTNGCLRHSFHCTHAAISRAEVVPKGLEILEFGQHLLAGFKVDKESMSDLDALVMFWREARLTRASVEQWISSARENTEKFRAFGIKDPTVTEVDEKVLSELDAFYGVEACRKATELIKAWVEKNSWTRSGAPLSQLD